MGPELGGGYKGKEKRARVQRAEQLGRIRGQSGCGQGSCAARRPEVRRCRIETRRRDRRNPLHSLFHSMSPIASHTRSIWLPPCFFPHFSAIFFNQGRRSPNPQTWRPAMIASRSLFIHRYIISNLFGKLKTDWSGLETSVMDCPDMGHCLCRFKHLSSSSPFSGNRCHCPKSSDLDRRNFVSLSPRGTNGTQSLTSPCARISHLRDISDISSRVRVDSRTQVLALHGLQKDTRSVF